MFFLKKNIDWIIYCLLFEHKSISIGQVSQSKFGFVNNIKFSDYFAIISMRAFINIVITKSISDVNLFIKRFDFLSKNEFQYLFFFINELKRNKVCYFSYSNLNKIKNNKCPFDEIKHYISIINEENL